MHKEYKNHMYQYIAHQSSRAQIHSNELGYLVKVFSKHLDATNIIVNMKRFILGMDLGIRATKRQMDNRLSRGLSESQCYRNGAALPNQIGLDTENILDGFTSCCKVIVIWITQPMAT